MVKWGIKNVEESALVEYFNNILNRVLKEGASDVHFEAIPEGMQIRYRKNGKLCLLDVVSKTMQSSLMSRIKILAHIDPAKTLKPQDARFSYMFGECKIDIRVAISKTQSGESVVLRLLDSAKKNWTLDTIGVDDDLKNVLKKSIQKSHGIFIVSGATGAGKTTTLYAILKELNSPEKKILSAEDPVEYQIDGITQVNMHAEIGLTFPNILRSFLRNDPDIIMIGEIRDAETAQIAFQAAMTGHLVLTSLHTNDAPSAIPRLMELGLKKYQIKSSLIGVLAQKMKITSDRGLEPEFEFMGVTEAVLA